MKRILLISTQDNAPSYSDRKQVLQTIADALDELDATVDTLLFEEMAFVIRHGEARIESMVTGKDVGDYDLVYVKNWKAHQNAASALAVYLDEKGVQFMCSELRHFRATDKIAEGFLFALEGLPYPDTFFTLRSTRLLDLIKQQPELRYPLVVKAVDASAGQDNHLVHSDEELQRIINSGDAEYMAQSFIPNDGDHRILVLGYQAKLSFKRTRGNESTHLNNTSQGASAVLTELESYSDAVIEHAITAARLVRREIAGVDVLYNKDTGEHVILEVNASPQLATGAFLPEKKRILIDYFTEILNA